MGVQKSDDIFLSILSKYDIYPEDFSFHNLHEKIYGILEEKCYGKRVAMWGAGEISNAGATYVAKFLDKYAYIFRKAVCVVDARKDYEGRELLGLPIILPESLPSHSPDIILITSFGSRKEIREDIRELYPEMCCLDIYEELESKGIEMVKDIFQEVSGYMEIYRKKTEYENCMDFAQKGFHLKSLIGKYVAIRDVPYVMKYMKEYISGKFAGYQRMELLAQELGGFLDEMRDRLKGDTKDVLMLFLDAFRGCDWYDQEKGAFRMMRNFSQKSACYVNMNATAPVTYESMYSIITGKLPMDGNVYDRVSFRLDEFAFLNEVRKDQYEIKMYFSDEYSLIDVGESVEYHRSLYLPEKLWRVLCAMADGDKPCLHFLYAETELHVPFLCGYHTVKPQKMTFADMGLGNGCSIQSLKIQFQNCLDYVDQEVEFFLGFVDDGVFKVLFSDHSHVVYDEEKEQPYYMYYNDIARSVHNVLMISGEGILPQKIESLASMKDFNSILLAAYRDRQILIPKNQIIHYQYYPVLNKSMRERAKDFEDGVKYIDGIRCFRDEEFLVAYPSEGQEEIYRLQKDMAVRCEKEEAREFLNKISR